MHPNHLWACVHKAQHAACGMLLAGPNKLGLKGQLQTNYGILATMRPNQFEILVLAVRRSFAPELRQHILPKLIMGFWHPCNLPEPERKGAMCKGIHPGSILIPVCAFEFTDFGNHAAIERKRKENTPLRLFGVFLATLAMQMRVAQQVFEFTDCGNHAI